MKKTNEIIQEWKKQLNKIGVITFSIQIDTSDFNQMVSEIEELQNKVERYEKALKEIADSYDEGMVTRERISNIMKKLNS